MKLPSITLEHQSFLDFLLNKKQIPIEQITCNIDDLPVDCNDLKEQYDDTK